MTSSIPSGVSSFIDVNDATLHMRRDGAWRAGPGGAAAREAEPPLLYLHSLGADMRIFDAVVARLPQRRHLRFDQLGHGLSDAPDGAYTTRRLAQDAIGVLGANGVDRAVLVGVSVGGLVALRAALDHPEAVAGLLLCSTAAKIGEADVWRARIETVAEQGVAALADSTLLRWFPEAFREANEPLIDGYRNMLARTSPVGYACTCAALAAEDLRPRLAELRQPALVVGGSDDLSTPPPVLRELAHTLKGARLEIIDEAGHLPMVDAPTRFTALLEEYLTELGHG